MTLEAINNPFKKKKKERKKKDLSYSDNKICRHVNKQTNKKKELKSCKKIINL